MPTLFPKSVAAIVLSAATGLAGTAAGAAAPAPAVPDSPQVRRAAELFATWEARGLAFDPALADLYCDDALVRNTRVHADGGSEVLEVPAPRYRALIRAAMPLARERGDISDYRDVTYREVGDGVRITASRYSRLKDYASPISILVGDCAGGYGIREEISESRP